MMNTSFSLVFIVAGLYIQFIRFGLVEGDYQSGFVEGYLRLSTAAVHNDLTIARGEYVGWLICLGPVYISPYINRLG